MDQELLLLLLVASLFPQTLWKQSQFRNKVNWKQSQSDQLEIELEARLF